MPSRRPRRTSPTAQGLSAGQKLKRAKPYGPDYFAWSWAGTEVSKAADITLEHRLKTCGFLNQNLHPFCANKYAEVASTGLTAKVEDVKLPPANGELEDDRVNS